MNQQGSEEAVRAAESASSERFHLKAVPILIALLLGVGILLLSNAAVELAKFLVKLPERPEMPWIMRYYEHFAQLVFALLAIFWMKRRHPGSYGLQWPPGKSYVAPAIFWGLVFGVVMTLVDYWPQILAHKPPNDNPYPLTTFNVAGWLSFEGLFVGPSEETLFRGLLVTYLARTMPGRISFAGLAMNGAGVVVAVLFALAHFGDFFVHPFAIALGQLGYAFVLGILYAYWYEKSQSLLAPVIGHNLGNVTEFALIFAMVAAYR
jgi:membrane protease YdiL (CAAX protease family)